MIAGASGYQQAENSRLSTFTIDVRGRESLHIVDYGITNDLGSTADSTFLNGVVRSYNGALFKNKLIYSNATSIVVHNDSNINSGISTFTFGTTIQNGTFNNLGETLEYWYFTGASTQNSTRKIVTSDGYNWGTSQLVANWGFGVSGVINTGVFDYLTVVNPTGLSYALISSYGNVDNRGYEGLIQLRKTGVSVYGASTITLSQLQSNFGINRSIAINPVNGDVFVPKRLTFTAYSQSEDLGQLPVYQDYILKTKLVNNRYFPFTRYSDIVEIDMQTLQGSGLDNTLQHQQNIWVGKFEVGLSNYYFPYYIALKKAILDANSNKIINAFISYGLGEWNGINYRYFDVSTTNYEVSQSNSFYPSSVILTVGITNGSEEFNYIYRDNESLTRHGFRLTKGISFTGLNEGLVSYSNTSNNNITLNYGN